HEAVAYAVTGAIIDVVGGKDQLFPKQLEVDRQQRPLDPRELAKPQDVEQYDIRPCSKNNETTVIAKDTPHFRDHIRRRLAADQVVEFEAPSSGEPTIGQFVAPDAGDIDSSGYELPQETSSVRRVLATGQ